MNAVESVIAQEGVRVEVLLVDDGSTDGSPEMIEKTYPQISIVRKINGGVSSARNLGLNLARGSFIKFLDSDDIMPLGSLKRMVDFSKTNPKSIIIGTSNGITEDGKLFSTGSYALSNHKPYKSEIFTSSLLLQATHSSLWLIPKDFLDESIFFDENIRLGEEYGFSRRIAQSGREILFFDDCVSTIRNHSGVRLSRSASELDYLKQLKEIELNVPVIRNLPEKNLDIAIRTIANRIWINGRDCHRFGYFEAARNHFDVAYGLAGDSAITGKKPYVLLARAFGPTFAETLFSYIRAFYK